MQLSNSGVNRLTWWAVGGAPNFTLQEDSIRTSWMDGHVLQGVPAALQPVHEHARDGHRQNARLHRNHAPSLASPAPPCPQTFLQVRRAKTTHGQHDSPVTCAPVGGQHPAQCMAVRPPPQGGQSVSGAGDHTPPQHTILRCDQQLPNRVYLSQFSIFITGCWS